MCLRNMSRLKRMQRLARYRKLRKNRPDPNRAQTISTPIVYRTEEQKERLRQLIENLAGYKIRVEHTLIEHVRTINHMLLKKTFKGKLLSDDYKYISLLYTLSGDFQESLIKCRLKGNHKAYGDLSKNNRQMLSENTMSYENLVVFGGKHLE